MKECSLGKDKELMLQSEPEIKKEKENPLKYFKCRNMLYLLKPCHRSEEIPGVTHSR